MALNPKRRQFCRNYVENGGNGTKAYQEAYKASGADARTSASHLLTLPDIQALIAELQAAKDAEEQERLDRLAQKADVSMDWVLCRLKRESRRSAASGGTAASRISALKLLGTYLGMWYEQIPAEQFLRQLPPSLRQILREELEKDEQPQERPPIAVEDTDYLRTTENGNA